MNPRVATILGIIIALAVFRLVPHPWNVTPVMAMALFGGAQLADRRLALAIPLGAMLLSDLVLGLHWTMPFVYAALAATVFLGGWLRDHLRPVTVIGSALAGSILFFVVTNFGAWLSHDMYPRSLEGLWAAYVAGLPFFRAMLIGDLLFVALLFGGFDLAERRFPAIRRLDAS
jgi:hypothetical protein